MVEVDSPSEVIDTIFCGKQTNESPPLGRKDRDLSSDVKLWFSVNKEDKKSTQHVEHETEWPDNTEVLRVGECVACWLDFRAPLGQNGSRFSLPLLRQMSNFVGTQSPPEERQVRGYRTIHPFRKQHF